MSNVQIDPGIRRIHTVHDLKADVGTLRDAGMILHAEHDALSPRIVGARFHGFNHPVDRLLQRSAGRKLAGKDTQMRSAQRVGHVHPLLDFG